MTDSITPVGVAALPLRLPRRRQRHQGTRLGLVACELLSLIALITIVAPAVRQIPWPVTTGLLADSPDLRDAHTTCQQLVRQADSLRGRRVVTSPDDSRSWSWRRLEDGRFRIVGQVDGRTRSGVARRTSYQCDLVPLNSNGRWGVDRLTVSREVAR
jgi:hypothetical protein